MRIVCPQCGAKYEVKDEKVRKKVFKIRCKRCTHEFVVRGEQEESQEQAAGQEAEAATQEPAAASEEHEATKVVDYSARQREIAEEEGAVWHVVINREQVGGLTAADVLAYLSRGEIDPDTFTWREGMADWARLSTVPEFADAVAQSTSQAGGEEQDDLGATAAIDVSAGLPAATSSDAEEDVMASNNVADGTAGGLFGGVDDVHDPRVTDPSQLRNQRNENSVLFSLDALAEGAGAAPAPQPQVSNTGGSEASGLIDMSLLDNFEAGPATSTQSEMDALFGAGAGPAAAMPMPTGAPIQPLISAKKSKIPMILGIAAGILVLVGGTAVVMMQVMDKGETTAVSAASKTASTTPSKFKIGGEAAETKGAPNSAKPADSANTAQPAAGKEAAATEKVAAATPATDTAQAKPAAKTTKKRPGSRSGRSSKSSKRASKKSASAAARPSAPAARPAPKPKPRRPKKSSGGDEVDDLLGALDGKPAARPSGGSRRPAASGGGDPSDDPLLPEKLGRKDILKAVRRGSAKVLNCKAGTSASGTVKVRITVAKTGRVQKASVISSNFQGTPVGRCVEGKVKKFRFPAFRKGPMSFNMPFKL